MLEVRNISKRYGSIHALSDVSLRVDQGEIVALVGENGAGKSTLVRCIARAAQPESGTIAIDGKVVGRTPRDAIDLGLSVVWQDLALCENLDVTANLFLGRELGVAGGLRTAAMHARAASVFDELDVAVPELNRPIERLSGGQRQLVAIARATLEDPKVLVLDEPTAALGIAESRTIMGVVRTLQRRGVCIVLVSHQLDEVFEVADRVVVMRHGTVAADLYRAETHPDDVVAMITGADVDSTAGQQLKRLHSLSEQLADADQTSVLPMTVSSLSEALSTERLALLLVEDESNQPTLRRSAALHLPPLLEEQLEVLDIESASFVAEAARDETLLVVPQLRDSPDDPIAQTAVSAGLAGAWAAPILGHSGPLAVIVGFSDKVTQLQPDQVQLLELFASMAGVAVERGKLVETLGDRNRALEGLRGVLETLAGLAPTADSLVAALEALCDGVGCDAAIVAVRDEGVWSTRSHSVALEAEQEVHMLRELDPDTNAHLRSDLHSALSSTFTWSGGRAGLVCLWAGKAPDEASEVIDGAANSFRLAMERELNADAEREAIALQRSRELERRLTRRIGHELRTPLTAIQGFASTMLQPDVAWPEVERQRFLEIIEAEAGRMGRLVAQMFDESALESGLLRLHLDYCDLVAVIGRATQIASAHDQVKLLLPSRCEIWGDADRLEQVFINLIGNAVRHNPVGTPIEVVMIDSDDASRVQVVVRDRGIGMPPDAVNYLTGVAADRDRDRGLGLRLVRGLITAHGGHVTATSTSDGDVAGTTIVVQLPFDDPAERIPQ